MDPQLNALTNKPQLELSSQGSDKFKQCIEKTDKEEPVCVCLNVCFNLHD